MQLMSCLPKCLASRLLPLFLLLVLLPVMPLQADEVLLTDGSRIYGEVVMRDKSILRFRTDFAGVIAIKWDSIVELKADKPMKLLVGPDELRETRAIRNTPEGLIVEADASEPDQMISPAIVEYINPEPWRIGEGFKFTGLLNFALQSERGNTDKDEIDMDGNLLWRSRDRRFRAFGELERDHNNNKKTKDKWTIDGAYNHFLTGRWYSGANLGFEHDTFADLDLRSKLGPILGYQWYEGRRTNLSTEAGPIYVNERFIEENNNDYVGAGWWINYDHYLFEEFMQFYHRQVGLWNLQHTGNLVWDTWTGLRFPLLLGFVASTEIKVEYDSSVSGDVKEVDTTFKLKLGYEW